MRVLARAAQLASRARSIDLPVLTQEMRIRQRGSRPFTIMFIYVVVLVFIAMLAVYSAPEGVWRQQTAQPAYQYLQSYHPAHASGTARVGRDIFKQLSMAQLVMLILVVPTYSAGAVSMERERATFDLLALTTLSSSSIIIQKLAAAISQALMLALASVPVMAVVFLLGGVSPMEVVIAYAVLVFTAGALGALGLACSCWLKTTRAATFTAYLVVGLFMLGVPWLGSWLEMVAARGLTQSLMDFPLMFTAMFVFGGGVAALLVFVALALLLKRKTELWRTRAFRMGIFGGVYALLLLVLSSPQLSWSLINALHGQGIFLPLFVNPYFAMRMFVEQPDLATAMLSGGHVGFRYPFYASWAVGATIVFAAASTYLFKQLSAFRFEALRRA